MSTTGLMAFIVNDDEQKLADAIDQTRFSEELKTLLLRELTDARRFAPSLYSLFKCVDMPATVALEQMVGAGPNDLIAHLVLGDDGELVMLALRALSTKAGARNKSSDHGIALDGGAMIDRAGRIRRLAPSDHEPPLPGG